MRYQALLLVGSMVFCGIVRAQENLVQNPSFENSEDGRPAAWDLQTRDNSSPGVGRDGGRTGDHFIRMVDTSTDGNVSVESAQVPCRPGGRYTASAWFRTTDTCSPGIYVNFYDEFGERIHHAYTRVEGLGEAWTQAKVTAVAPEHTATVAAMLYAYMGDTGTVDADDAVMTVAGGEEPGSMGVERVQPGGKPVLGMATRREVFLDDAIIDGFAGSARRILHQPTPREVVLVWDRPWEGPLSLYVTVLHDGEKIRIYYRGWSKQNKEDCCAVAESVDGIHFTRPSLGLYEWEGSTDNNICYMGPGGHNFTPFLDSNPDAPPEQAWKAVASAGPKASLVPFVSPDGYRWSVLQEEPVITKGAFDSQNLAFWNPHIGKYVEFHRGFRDGIRDIMTSTSDDFLNWTEPRWLSYGHARREHLYTNAITVLERVPHMYIGMPCRFVPGRKKIPSHKESGINDGLLMSSRDGLSFQRWPEAFLRPAADDLVWTDRCNYPSWGIVRTSETEYSIYWSEHYRYPSARLRRGTIRVDGFVSVGAGAGGGELLTRPMTFSGKRLEVNYRTSAAGALRFELCDTEGKPYDGVSYRESPWLYGNDISHTVVWRDGSDVSALVGQPVRLRVWLRDADLFSFRFAD